MDCEYSVLRNVTRIDIREYPFPHVVVQNCLPAALYDELANIYPDDASILRLSGAAEKYFIRQNHRYDLSAHRLLRQPTSVAAVWREFVRYHVSTAFFREFAALFGPELHATYPALEQRFGREHKDWTTGIRYDPECVGAQVALDCQIGINTPVRRLSSARGVHTDAPDELFAMLLYFRPESDRVSGGDLDIYRWKNGSPHLFVGREVDPEDAELVSTVAYGPNTLVAFINSATSLHAVSPRVPSTVSRRLVNIVGRVHQSVPEGLFEQAQKTGWRALRARVSQRVFDRLSRRRFWPAGTI
jgi:hypothetical protein